MEAILSKNHRELIYRMLNRTVALCHYDRASCWAMHTDAPKLLGVSGQSDINKYSELAEKWREMVGALPDPKLAAMLAKQDFQGQPRKVWDFFETFNGGYEAVWLPLFSRDHLVAGLWLERWGLNPWREAELKLLASLSAAYGAAYERFDRRKHLRSASWFLRHKTASTLIFAAVLLLLCFIKIPLRVVAPCEVVPADPYVVTAPLNGVIAEALVEPGQGVKEKTPLFIYDKRVATEELNVAKQQVQIIESTLDRSLKQAFSNRDARSELSLLRLRLEQEQIKLRVAEYNVSKLEVFAETPGSVVIDDPSSFRGKPVVIGEKILVIVTPGKTKIRIWLPEDDNIDFDPNKTLAIFLNAFPEREFSAKLEYISESVGMSPKGMPSVLAEANWEQPQHAMKMGLKGSAILYGKDVSALYWLFRKPLAWTRKTIGV